MPANQENCTPSVDSQSTVENLEQLNLELPVEEVETCSTCEYDVEDCTCFHCEGCNRDRDSERIDQRPCGNCLDCCIHYDCDTCGAHRNWTCSDCDRCEDCCNCVTCNGCDSRVRYQDITCTDCDRCSDCGCECESDSASIEFFRSRLTFHKGPVTPANPSKRFISTEIEVTRQECDYVSDVVREWKGCIVEDNSLPSTGFEINTAPASGSKWSEQVTEICEGLDRGDAEVTRDCGLHIHIDARDFTYYDLRKLIRLYAKIERALFAVVADSRQYSSYCTPCGARLLEGIESNVTNKQTRKQIFKNIYGSEPTRYANKKSKGHQKYDSARYAALNLHSWLYRGTIECRLHQGTLSARNIEQWGILWARILDYAYKSTEKTIESLIAPRDTADAFVLLCTLVADLPDTLTWLLDRAERFNRIPTSTLDHVKSTNMNELKAEVR